MKQPDFLVEILTEELPPKALLNLSNAFHQQLKERLEKANLTFKDSKSFATPRRLAVIVNELAEMQPDQTIERKGPAVSAAFDASGNPTQPCIGFAKSCGVTPAELIKIKSAQGEWVGYRQQVKGKAVNELLPEMVEQSVQALPIPKRMRWGDGDTQFVRPVKAVVMLYGENIVEGAVLGCAAGRETLGHRFLSQGWIAIEDARHYEKTLEENFVVVDFAKRRKMVFDEAQALVKQKLGANNTAIINDELWDEVTSLVEWPVALCGQFDKAFLNVPKEVLISAMQDHQRYFPVTDGVNLLPNFITLSNINSKDAARVIHGNERVLRARLSDAAFFFEIDKKEKLIDRVERLKGIVYQAKLGTLHDKAVRLKKLTVYIAEKTGANVKEAREAGLLAKTDLTTNMVNEFPELQGLMGYYYSKNEGEPENVAVALKEQYLPRFSGDVLPANTVGKALALADKIDVLAGSFAINQIPTGDKDPFGLRRAAIGIIRILIEDKVNLDLKDAFEYATSLYQVKLENKDSINQLFAFMQERLRSWYLDQQVSADILAAVFALGVTNPLDISKRVKAVQVFKKLTEAEALSIANKRVSNILEKQTPTNGKIDVKLFEHDAERVLLESLEKKQKTVETNCQQGQYEDALKQLAELRQPIDDFFDHVMVMTEDEGRRKNRLVLLSKLRKLFLQVADIALLQ